MNKTNRIRFIIVDKHSVVRHGMSFILKKNYENSTVYQFDNIIDVLKVLEEHSITLLILNINLSDNIKLNIIQKIKKIQPSSKILIFSEFNEEMYALRFIAAGANGFLSILSSEDEIKNAIISVMSIGKYTSKNMQDRIMDSYILKTPTNPLEQLSNREIEIARLLVDGHTNKYISEKLCIKSSTVSTYKDRIFKKLSINTITHLIQIFYLYS